MILNTLGRITRSYELYAGKKNFFTVPTAACIFIGVREIFCQGGGKPFAQKILRSCPNFYETYSRKETRAIICNNIGRTGI